MVPDDDVIRNFLLQEGKSEQSLIQATAFNAGRNSVQIFRF